MLEPSISLQTAIVFHALGTDLLKGGVGGHAGLKKNRNYVKENTWHALLLFSKDTGA